MLNYKMIISSGTIQIVTTAVVLCIAGFWIIRRRRGKNITNNFNKLVFITGCDSGFGFSMALYCHELGLSVCASMLNPDGEAGDEMRTLMRYSHNFHVMKMDVTDTKSVQRAVQSVEEILQKHNLELYAVVNNAGIMVFAESEWQTENLIKQQLEVNLIGAIRVTKLFSPLLRKYQGRVININSHCGFEALPGLSVYSASKAGLKMWSDSLRIELGKFGVKVITFIPGSFFAQSNILARQREHAEEMKQAMSSENLNFYEDYFDRFNTYLGYFSGKRPIKQIKYDKLYKNIKHVILSQNPRPYYCVNPLKYAFYHFLFKIAPCVWIRDKLVVNFIKMPKFKE